VDERNVGTGRLEVEETLRLDLGEALRVPRLGEVPTGQRGALSPVVPASERGDQDRLAQARAGGDLQFVSDRRSLRSVGRTRSRGRPSRPRRWPPGRRARARGPTADACATAARRGPSAQAARRRGPPRTQTAV